MPVFQRDGKKVLFLHVPKAGGTSIEEFFKKNDWEISFLDRGGDLSWNKFMKCSPQHMHAEILEKIFKINSFHAIFITVRHPFERIKSEFKWRKKY